MACPPLVRQTPAWFRGPSHFAAIGFSLQPLSVGPQPASRLVLPCAFPIGLGLPQLRLQRLGHGDVRKGDHHAVDHVLQGAVGHDAHGEPAPVAGGDLFLRTDQRPQHFPRVLGQFRVEQVGGDIGDRPAHVAGDQLMILVVWLVNRRTRSSLSRNRVAMSVLSSRFFMSLLRPGQIVHLGLQLGVDRLQFLVHGLHLFLGGGQFLVGGLQFLVGGLQFLVGGFEFFLRGLHLFAGGLQLLAGLLRAPAPVPPAWALRAGACRDSCPAAFVSGGVATSVKTTITKPRSASGSSTAGR